ncbi:MAG: hypothetical protein ACK4IK_11315 [Bacteroidia bacterium]
MIFQPINVEKALKKERQHLQNTTNTDLLDEVNDILQQAAKEDAFVINRLNGKILFDELKANCFDDDKVYSIAEIKRICEKYRLRFLDSKYFKGEIPYEAISEIKHLEKKNNITFTNFKIVAPAGIFKLENVHKDPLLFASLGNGKYYLIHKWGNDLAWHRRIFAYPLQNIYTFFITIFILSAILSAVIPESWLNMPMGSLTLRLWLTIHLFIGFSGFLIFLGSTMQKNFSSNVWNSCFFNE